jgi:hypothetical protein
MKDDEVKKLLQEATEALDVPFEPPLGKGALMKVRAQVSTRIKFYRAMAERGLPIAGGIESGAALVRAIDNYLQVATARTEPDPSPEEWWASVLDQAQSHEHD